MSIHVVLEPDELALLGTVAGILLPGSVTTPAASALSDLDVQLGKAVHALGSEGAALKTALSAIPADVDWAALKAFAERDPEAFELISATAAGAYFMSPTALGAIGYPIGPRRAPRMDQAADELGGGLLDAVLDRGSLVRWPPSTDSQEF